MPIDPNDLRTGGAVLGAVADSLLRQRERAAELHPGDQVDIYKVTRELGRGGMAIVYLAERADGEYEQQVALKWMLQAQPDEDSAVLFRRERQALAHLRHPHIARLLDGGRTGDGRPWFAMELIEGERLDRHCVRAEVPLPRRLDLFLQVCSAVAFAHARGVIHRDIKPSNVLVDGDGSAKLLDFGIAQLLGQDDGLATAAFTPGFASPEQMRGEAVTVAADIYQLGRLLAAITSNSETEQDTLATTMLVHGPASAATAQRGGITGDLAAIIDKACAPEPGARYATADAFAADIRAFAERRPIAARPRTARYVMTQFMRRHPRGAWAAIVVTVMVAGMTTLFTVRLKSERDVAQRERTSAEAINRFLNEDVLDAANPLRRAPGAPEVTVREALDAAESRVDERFGTQPKAAMSVLATLGVLRYEFGDHDRSMKLYERALVYAEQLPAADEGRLRVRAERAALMITLQDFDAAIAELETLIGDATIHLGADHSSTLEWQLRLLEARSGQGGNPAFIDALRALRDRAERALGKPNAISGEASLMAADGLILSGKAELALDDADHAYAALGIVLGTDHPSTLKAMTAVAHVRRALGRGDEAVAMMRRAYSLQTSRFGADSGDSMFMQNELGFTLTTLGRYAESEAIFTDLVQRRERARAGAPMQLTQALGNLANTQLRQGRAADALAGYQRAADVIADEPKIPASVRTTIHRGKADALRELGRFDESATALDASSEAATSLPENDVRRFALQGSRARLLLAQGRSAEGLQMLDDSIASMRANVAETNPLLKTLVQVRASIGAPSP